MNTNIKTELIITPTLIPKMTWRGILIMGLVWTAYALVTATIISVNVGIPFAWAITGQIFSSTLMAVTSIPPWLLFLKWMHPRSWRWKIIAHVIVSPLYGIANYEGYSLILYIITRENPIADRYGWIVLYNVMLYIIQFSVYHTITTMKQLRWKEQQAIELSALASEQELAALKSQINPHFLFNTLNSINAMVSRDAEETRSMIVQLGDLLRYVVDASKKDFVFFNEELEFTKSYLALESKRLSDRLEIVYNIAPEVLNRKIPSLIIQPLVENAIKHGIEPSEDGGTVTIQAAIYQDWLNILVKDSYLLAGKTEVDQSISPNSVKGNGLGLHNINARLHILYGKEASLITNTVANGGFEVKISLPLGIQ